MHGSRLRNERTVTRRHKTSKSAHHELIVWQRVNDLHPSPNNSRVHPEKQLTALAKSIARLGMSMPIMIDEEHRVIIGHGRLAAAAKLGWKRVPTIMRADLSESDKRALMIADNRLPEQAVWDMAILSGEFKALIDVQYDVELTGFSTGEIDILLDGKPTPSTTDSADEIDPTIFAAKPVSRRGDLWLLGRHSVLCGDALSKDDYRQLMPTEAADLIVTDPPYNVKIMGHARGRGKQHREFAMASGEMSDNEFECFLRTMTERLVAASVDGSIHYIFMDWRHLPSLLRSCASLYSDWKQLLVWNKSNAGQGSFYRSKHELIAVFKNGEKPHVNNFGLGTEGRYRANVLDYPGGSSLDPRRRELQDLHPTVKPVALIADLIRDCSRRNGIVLDPFAGSGTILLAAERTGRVARAMEIDPQYVDVAVRRWELLTGKSATLVGDGRTFAEIESSRQVSISSLPPNPAQDRTPSRRRSKR